ncbi:sensor histidine kinase [Chloroflexota bacterium]
MCKIPSLFGVQEIFLKPSRVDRQRLVQAINNLVSNALKFTPVGGRVSIKETRMNGVVVVKISGTGPGISAEDQARPFQRFSRTDDSRQRQIPGTGLGLSIVRAIAEQDGGEAYCRSRLGKGLVARLALRCP